MKLDPIVMSQGEMVVVARFQSMRFKVCKLWLVRMVAPSNPWASKIIMKTLSSYKGLVKFHSSFFKYNPSQPTSTNFEPVDN